MNIEYVPEDQRNEDLYQRAFEIMKIKYGSLLGLVIQDFIKLIPKEFQNDDMCNIISTEMVKSKGIMPDILDFLKDDCKNTIKSTIESNNTSCCIV